MHQIYFKTLIFHIKNLNKYPTQNRVHIRKKQKKKRSHHYKINKYLASLII